MSPSVLRMSCAISDLHARYQRKRCLRRYALKGRASRLKQRLARSQRPAKGTPVMSPNVLGGIPYGQFDLTQVSEPGARGALGDHLSVTVAT